MKISEDLLQLIAADLRGEVIEVLRDWRWYEICALDELLSSYYVGSKLRIKPKTITLAGVEFPEPMRVAPKIGEGYWLAYATEAADVSPMTWNNELSDKWRLKRGLVQARRQGALDQTRAMVLSVGGSLE